MVKGIYVDLVAQCIGRANVNDHDNGKYQKRSNLLMYLLRSHSTTKKQKWINDIAEIVKMFLDHGFNLNEVDIDGLNITDYLNYYQ